jgi:hypothetical protein
MNTRLGSIFMLTSGHYDSYRVDGLYVVRKEFNPTEIWFNLTDPDEDKYIKYLLDNGFVSAVAYSEYWTDVVPENTRAIIEAAGYGGPIEETIHRKWNSLLNSWTGWCEDIHAEGDYFS